MASAKKLLIQHDYDFIVVGISCHEKSYRLCWALNTQLQSSLSRNKHIELTEKNKSETTLFPVFSYNDEARFTNYRVISNKVKNKTLVAEFKQADYLLVIQGEAASMEKNRIIASVKEVSFVQTAFEIPVEKIKSKDLFIL